MIDIEFMVQYLVLQYAHTYPELTVNMGNIGLLKMMAGLGLIDTDLAAEVGNAYRKLRKLQHQLRLQGQDLARVEPALVADEVRRVLTLWEQLFGPRMAT